MTLDLQQLTAFTLVFARTTAWVLAAPVFGMPGLASVGRLAVAISLSLFLTPIAEVAGLPTDLPTFLVLLVGQVLVGLALGWAMGVLLNAFQVAGSTMDLQSGLGIGTLFDPMTGSQVTVFARFYNLLFMALLVATNAHHTLLDGFVRSFRAIPAGTFPTFGEGALDAAGMAVSNLMVAAIEIGAPVLGALFLTEVALALTTRFVPQANVFAVGLPVKVLLTLVVVGTTLITVPSQVGGLVDSSLRTGEQILSG